MADESSDFWFWAAPDGSLKTVDRQELTRSLANGVIPARAMVWRPGWADWLRAGQVAELSASVPAGARGPIVEPVRDERISRPPPLPTLPDTPIVPVPSNPENDRPGTALLVDVELDAGELEVVEPVAAAPAPPARKSSAPPRPLASPAKNGWVEEKKDPAELAPIVPVESSPHHEPITGMIGEEEIEIIEAAAGETVKKKEPEKPAASVPSLDSLAAAVEARKPKPVPVIAVSPMGAVRAAPPGAALPATAVAGAPRPVPAASVLLPDGPDSDGPTRAADAIIPVSEPDNDAPTQIHPAALRDDAPLPSWGDEVDAMAAAARAEPPPPAPPANPWVQTPAPPAAVSSYGPPPAAVSSYGPPPTAAVSSYGPPPAAVSSYGPPTAAVSSYGPPTALPPSYEAPKKKSSALPLVLGGLLAVGLVGAAAVGGLLYVKPWQSAGTTQPVATSAAPAQPAAAKPPPGPKLTITKEATRLAPAMINSVPPYFQALSRSRLALGIAKSDTVGLGLEIDATTLGVREAFTSTPGTKIVGVVPVGTRFVVDREGGALLTPHTLEENVVIGFGANGYSRRWKGGVETLWPSVKSTSSSEARVATVSGVGHAVTFRSGGEVRMGWLEPGGAKKSDLGTIRAEGKLGAPTIAANDTSVLVAFAAKPSDDAPWAVELAMAKHGEITDHAEPFALPAGGPGGDAIAPTAAGLPKGRWLLQWTEGGAGERVVRVQLLDDKLAPLGDAVKVSPAGKEAGQGVIAVSGGKVVAFSLVKGDSTYELWGTALSLD